MEPLRPGDVDRFRRLVATSLGLRVEADRLDWLADILRQRAQQRGFPSVGAYLGEMEAGGEGGEEWRELANQLTVVETYFFRSPAQFRTLANRVLPERLALRNGRRPLRMLSAGCASGEEPYSLAITVREHFPHLQPEDVTITAFDINSRMLAQAAGARYTAWSLRDVPQELCRKYFQVNGKHYTLRSDIRTMVGLEERNLATPGETLWEIEQYDVIFCRNMVMYLTAEAARVAVERLRHALCPGGYLFLSPAETLRGVSNGFHLRQADDCFFYQKREGTDALEAGTDATHPPVPAAASLDISWVEAVRRSSQRVASLSQDLACHGGGVDGSAPATVTNKAGRPAVPSQSLGAVLQLLQEERFQDALHLMHALSAQTNEGLDAQLLRAVILTNCGDVASAEMECRTVLRRDELNASAHYVTALCREHLRDRQGALEHDRAAIYLDPAFAMPHLHLGLLAKSMGDTRAARQELQQAITLLEREDPSRILLLGGGFSREALLEFGRAQLGACGGTV